MFMLVLGHAIIIHEYNQVGVLEIDDNYDYSFLFCTISHALLLRFDRTMNNILKTSCLCVFGHVS